MAKLWTRAFLVGLLMGAPPVFATTSTANIDSSVGLQPVLTLSCSPIKFGVWKTPIRDNGQIEQIILGLASDAARSDLGLSALSSLPGHAPMRGFCSYSGSALANGSTVRIAAITHMANGFSVISLVSDSASPYGLPPPGTLAIPVQATLMLPATAAVNNGTATFYLGGYLVIPPIHDSTKFGAYKTYEPFTVQVTE